MDNKRFCLELILCEKESEVLQVLTKYGYWDDDSAWSNYGGNENNFSVVGNQQSRPEAALVEKLINSVDAVLMAECLTLGVDPEGGNAPQSILEAVSRYFGVSDGKLFNITPTERGSLAENICLVATGTKHNPCYSVIDRGEGQVPEKFIDTFLSLGKSNKLRIPFVQGKFNQGGTGVFQFCGTYNFQLIISKRHPGVAKSEMERSKNKWGLTIIRRDNPSEGVRSSTYKYFAPNGKILAFESETLPLLPGKYPNAYSNKLAWGTFIKLFEYQMIGLKTNVLFDLYNRLSLLMPSVALPIRFFERRKGYSGHTFETTLSGLTVRLEEDKRSNLEIGFPASLKLSVLGEKMTANVFAFKRGASEKYTKDEGVIFTINGQTHAHLSKSFFSRKAVAMGYLSNSLLVIIDCTNIDGRAREDLFMTSRDRLRSGQLKTEIERSLEDQLRNHPGLKELRERRRREDIEGKLADSKPLAEIIEDIIKKSPTLAKLFVQGVRLQNPFLVEKTARPKKVFEGKRFPTFFTLIKKHTIEHPKCSPINVKLRVQYETDATNDYFDRDSEPGAFSLKINKKEIQDYSLNLWNGIASLNISIPSETSVGDVIHFESNVSDASRIDPIYEDFFVRILDKIKKSTGEPKERKRPPSDEEDGSESKPSSLALPNVIEVKREDWGRHYFNEQSVLKVEDTGEDGYDFFINIDNIHLLTEKKVNTRIDPKLLDARYKYGMVLVGIALLKDYEDDEKKGRMDEEKNIFSTIADVSKSLSPILLPMIASLGELEIEEIEKVHE